nr:hypothetical protein [Tanacetum cinerariifolium]
MITLRNSRKTWLKHERKRKRVESPKTPPGSPPHQPPPPPPPAGPSGALGASGSSQQPPPSPLPSSTNQESLSTGSTAPSSSKTAASAEYQAWTTTGVRLRPPISSTPADLEMDEDMDWWKPLEEERPATPEPAWSILSSDAPVPPNNWAPALASNYSPPPEDSLLAVDDPILRNNVSKPLPLGGPPGQVTIQSDFFFNKDLEYIRYGSKGSRPALSISKLKAAYYPDAGLEQMVPDQFWIEEECKYDIAAMYVRTHMQILSVVRIKVFSLYGYDYMKKIVLRRANLNEHVIAKRDFKQCVEDFQLGIKSYQNQLNLTKPQWDATGFEYKHDYTQLDEALDYKIEEFKINRMNPVHFPTVSAIKCSKEFPLPVKDDPTAKAFGHCSRSISWEQQVVSELVEKLYQKKNNIKIQQNLL